MCLQALGPPVAAFLFVLGENFGLHHCLIRGAHSPSSETNGTWLCCVLKTHLATACSPFTLCVCLWFNCLSEMSFFLPFSWWAVVSWTALWCSLVTLPEWVEVTCLLCMCVGFLGGEGCWVGGVVVYFSIRAGLNVIARACSTHYVADTVSLLSWAQTLC